MERKQGCWTSRPQDACHEQCLKEVDQLDKVGDYCIRSHMRSIVHQGEFLLGTMMMTALVKHCASKEEGEEGVHWKSWRRYTGEVSMAEQVNADAMTLVRYHLMEMNLGTSLGITGVDGKHSQGFDEYP